MVSFLNDAERPNANAERPNGRTAERERSLARGMARAADASLAMLARSLAENALRSRRPTAAH